MAVWNPDDHFLFEPNFEENRHRRRKNAQGNTLTSSIVITHNGSLNHLTDKREKHIDSIAKVNYVLVKHLYDFVNATMYYTVESTWGYKNNQSEWSGMIGELTKNKADIGGTALFITADRVAIIDYIAMTTKTRSKFVFREPKLSYVTNVFVLPFDRKVWISTIALVILTGFTLLVIVKWEKRRKEYESNGQNVHLDLEDSFADIAVLTFGAFCQQGASAIPYSLPGRITTIFLFISLMFLYTSYSANIVALLQSSSKSIQTLEDLLKSRLEVGVDDTVFNHFYFPNATEPIRKALYQKKVVPPGQPPRFYPILEGVKIMRQGLFAFHMETGPGYKIVGELFEEGEKCSLQEIQFLQVPDPWLAIQKNSSFKESLKIGLFLIRESGLQNREIDAIYTKKPVCANRGNTFISVGIVDCYAPAVVLAGGVIISFCLFVFEHFVHLRSKLIKRRRHDLINLSNMVYNEGSKLRINNNGTHFLHHPLDAEVQVNIIDSRCPETKMILHRASTLGLLKKPFRWIIFGNIKEIETIEFHPLVDSNFFIVEKTNGNLVVTAIYKLSKNSTEFKHTKIADWNIRNSFQSLKPLSIYGSRRNLNGTMFTFNFWASSPITYKTVSEYRYTHIDPSIRFTYAITELLTAIINVTRSYLIHNSTSYAQFMVMLQEIRDGKATMGAMPFFFLGDRLPWLDYIAPNTRSYLFFIFRAPPLSYVTNIFTRPFQQNVWYASFLLSALTFLVMYIIVKWEWKDDYFRRKIETSHDVLRPSADNVAILQMGVMSQQGSDTELKSVSGRIAFVSTLITFMFLYTAYSGMIVALLQSTSNMITTLDDLLNSGIELGVENLSYVVLHTDKATEKVRREIYLKKLQPKGDKHKMSLNEGVEKMRTEFFAFHTESTSAYKVIGDTFQESEKCKLQEISYATIIEPWIIATKNHSYKELMRVGFAHMREQGFYSAQRRRIFNEKPECTNKAGSFVSAGLIDTYAAFMLFGVGFTLAVVIFLAEIITSKPLMKTIKK
ncbi:uncharacterized protein LOC123680189 [Harmonia axyridis]|uniref:uncharacterized protein LOC123680189 n=1 Tax=Harmonia axyridis TaxID=115357 RepID=UPI001E27785D|nr:uncharacterized protein LOC123680189 [Harmonia axyridis]